MIITKPAYFIQSFIENLNIGIKELKGNAGLTKSQKAWLGFCMMGILLLNSICWKKFERASLGKYSLSRLSWMFRKSKITWNLLLIASIKQVLKQHGIKEGILAVDETDKPRSKKTKHIYKAYKQKDKKTGGYVNGQTIVFLLLISNKVSIPVGFAFYMPDPVLKTWKDNDDKLKKQGICKKDRPVEPQRDPNYPTKTQIALKLLQEFKEHHNEIQVQAMVADALYGESKFMNEACKIEGIQVISQLSKNQNIWHQGHKISVCNYFNSINKGTNQTIRIRGGKEVNVIVSSARLKVDAHGVKRFVIALKYKDEKNYRYLVATDLSWCTKDIIQAYTLRWLIEVFFSDWKLNEGWGREAKQYDEEGASRGLLLSLLLDHCLLLHPEQTTCIENKLPAYTVGSLQRLAQIEALLEFIASLLKHHDPAKQLHQLAQTIKDVFKLIPSDKHISGRDLGNLCPT